MPAGSAEGERTRRPSFTWTLVTVLTPVVLMLVRAAADVWTFAADLPPTHLALVVLAIGAGSLFFSHVNDAGFWLVKE